MIGSLLKKLNRFRNNRLSLLDLVGVVVSPGLGDDSRFIWS
jgi:hypothetical protein